MRITAAEQGVVQLGAVLSYGAVVAPLQARWVAMQREGLSTRFAIRRPRHQARGRWRRVGNRRIHIAEQFDLAVVAEGGVFAEQDRKRLSRDYEQNAWVGQVRLAEPGFARPRHRTLHAQWPARPAAPAP